jgi:hypothetical protein
VPRTLDAAQRGFRACGSPGLGVACRRDESPNSRTLLLGPKGTLSFELQGTTEKVNLGTVSLRVASFRGTQTHALVNARAQARTWNDMERERPLALVGAGGP